MHLEALSHDIVNKHSTLDATQKELGRLVNANKGLSVENSNLHHDIDIIAKDCMELDRHVKTAQTSNQNLISTLQKQDMTIKDKETQLVDLKNDISALDQANNALKIDLDAQHAERDANDQHAKTLTTQNDQLSSELAGF